MAVVAQIVLRGVSRDQYGAVRAAANAFAAERLGPAMAQLGIAVQPEVTFYPAHEVYAPQAITLT